MTITPEALGAILCAIGIAGAFARVVQRLARLELKVETIWDFQVRRAFSEAVFHDVVKRNSPVTVPIEIKEEAKEWMAGLREEICGFYAEHGKQLSDSDLMLELERHFGERIVHEVCIPHGLFAGACLLIAMEVAKDKP